MDLVDFDYELPREAIAQHPAQPRDSARLLDMDGLVDRHFRDLPELLAPGDLLVVNRTRVRPARLVGRRETGGSVEVLLLRPAGDLWRALVRPARKLPQGASADFDGLLVTVERHLGDGLAEVRVESDRDLEAEIARVGQMPLPPYITEQLADDSRYQTVYADEVGSAAAPTAGLHFTPALLERLERGGVEIAAVVLEVGLDTFRPITSEVVEEHVIHSESYSVDDSVVTAIGRTRETGGRVIAVGTTSVRALESAAIGDGLVEAREGRTDLYITPGYRPRVVDGLITNFHMPGTTLIVMIAALFGERWRPAYEHALDSGYRFLSFGDAMFGWVR